MAKQKQKSDQAPENGAEAQVEVKAKDKPKAGKAKGKGKAEAKANAAAEAKAKPKAKAQAAEGPTGLPGKVAELKGFFEEAKGELKKVTFPTRKETVATSTAVLILAFIMALFLGLVDLGLSKFIKAILS